MADQMQSNSQVQSSNPVPKQDNDSGLTWKGLGASAARGASVGTSALVESPETKLAYEKYSSKHPLGDLAMQTAAGVASAALASVLPGTKAIAAAEWISASSKFAKMEPMIKQMVQGFVYGGATAEDNKHLESGLQNAFFTGSIGSATHIAAPIVKKLSESTGIGINHVQNAIQRIKDVSTDYHMSPAELLTHIKSIKEGATPMAMGQSFTNLINKAGKSSPLLIPDIQAKASKEAFGAADKALTAFTKQKSPIDSFVAEQAKINDRASQERLSHYELAQSIPIKYEGATKHLMETDDNVTNAIFRVQESWNNSLTKVAEDGSIVADREEMNFRKSGVMTAEQSGRVVAELKQMRNNASNPSAAVKEGAKVSSAKDIQRSEENFRNAIESQNMHIKDARKSYSSAKESIRIMDAGRKFIEKDGVNENKIKIDPDYFKSLKEPHEIRLFQQGLMAELSNRVKYQTSPNVMTNLMNTTAMKEKMELVFGPGRSKKMETLVKRADATINGARAVNPKIVSEEDITGSSAKIAGGLASGSAPKIMSGITNFVKSKFPSMPEGTAKLVIDASMREGGLEDLLAKGDKLNKTQYIKVKQFLRENKMSPGDFGNQAVSKSFPIAKGSSTNAQSKNEIDEDIEYRKKHQ